MVEIIAVVLQKVEVVMEKTWLLEGNRRHLDGYFHLATLKHY